MRRPSRIAILLAAVALLSMAVFLVSQLYGRTLNEAGKIVGLAGGLVALAGAVGKSLQSLRRLSQPAPVDRPGLDQVEDLAAAVHREWEAEATRRKLLAPAPLPTRWTFAHDPQWPTHGAVGVPGQPRRFPTLPGLRDVTEEVLLEGGGLAELHGLYGGLASGRLVIAGEPGVGKTGAGVLLLLEALNHRARVPVGQLAQVPVPVMFTLAGWDPRTTPFGVWFAGRLADAYFQGRPGLQGAGALLADGHVTAFLDGLDEIAAELRPLALEALSSSQVRIVLLTRSRELGLAAEHQRLVDAAVIQVSDVDGVTAADYLERSLPGQSPAHWAELLALLGSDPQGPMARSLRTPLTLTLLRDTYRGGDDVGDLIEASRTADGPRAVEAQLLDRVVAAAYTPRLGEPAPRYSIEVAQRTLTFLAAHMSGEGTRDLAWWRVHRWAPRLPRHLITGLLAAPFLLLLSNPLIFVPPLLASGLVILTYRRRKSGPQRLSGLRPRDIPARPALEFGLLASSVAMGLVLVMFVIFSLDDRYTQDWAKIVGSVVVAGVVFGVLGGVAFGVFKATVSPSSGASVPVTPRELWRADQSAGRIAGLLLGPGLWLPFALAWCLMGTVSGAPGLGLLVLGGGLLWGLGFGLMVGFTWPEMYTARLTFLQIAVRHKTPVRLMRFLEDAQRREVLRALGPVYQFRHAGLQERLTQNQG